MQASDWRPSETAPKDGSLFLAWDVRGLQGVGYARCIGWYRSSSGGRQYCWIDFWSLTENVEFTHWQPIVGPVTAS